MLVNLPVLQKIIVDRGPNPSFLRDFFFREAAFYQDGKVQFEIERKGQQVAPFVAPEVGGVVMERLGREVKEFDIPEVSPQRVITNKNLIPRSENGIEFIEAGSNRTTRQLRLIRDDFDSNEGDITRREELMCSEALFYGQVTIEGEGYEKSVIQYWDQSDKPYKKLTGKDLWTAETADILGDIEFGITQVQERSGMNTRVVIMSPATWSLARKNKALLEQLDITNLKIGEIYDNTRADDRGVRLVGRLNDVAILTYNKKVKPQNADGDIEEKQLVPDGLVLFGSEDVPTEMAYGVVTITDTNANTLRHVVGKRVPNQYLSQKKPAGIVNETKSSPLPVTKLPDGFYVLEVGKV